MWADDVAVNWARRAAGYYRPGCGIAPGATVLALRRSVPPWLLDCNGHIWVRSQSRGLDTEMRVTETVYS